MLDMQSYGPLTPAPANILTGNDSTVAAWTWKAFNLTPMYVNRAFGILDGKGRLCGAVIFSNYNGVNVEFCYYAKGYMTRRMLRYFMAVALYELKVERVTINARRDRKRMRRALHQFGCKVEGVLRRYYGRDDTSHNAAVQHVVYREQLEKLITGPHRRY